MVRKGGNGVYCCDASRVDHDDAHAFTNYASPSPAEIGALGDEGRIRRKLSEKVRKNSIPRNSGHKFGKEKSQKCYVFVWPTTNRKTIVFYECVLTTRH